ncbi:DUF2155 domain-containing protein [Labrenzia aggregata]|uniref:DUF2155 domain-containing protein n=2 Tax=Roseibium aggregatum TaxID=187304 RepID=A0A939ECX0_9HYPH|nr:DUF2155 domain-containing protein [Roseibium aggregatum]
MLQERIFLKLMADLSETGKAAQRLSALLGLALTVTVGLSGSGFAEKIENPVAVFSGLDKITGRIISFDVYIGETVQFGALQVTPRVCHTRPQTESPLTTGFVQVDEITLNNEVRRIFSGWMYAASPGLHAVEHPVYDIWLTDCKLASKVPPPDDYDGPPIKGVVADGEDPLAGPDDGVESGPGVPRPKPFQG